MQTPLRVGVIGVNAEHPDALAELVRTAVDL